MIRAPKPSIWPGVAKINANTSAVCISTKWAPHFIYPLSTQNTLLMHSFVSVSLFFFTAIAAHFPAQDTNKKKPLNFCTISIGTDSRKYPQGQGLLTIHYFDFYCTSLWLFSSVCFVEYPFRCHPCMFARLIGSWNSRCLLYASDNGEYNRRKDDKKKSDGHILIRHV